MKRSVLCFLPFAILLAAYGPAKSSPAPTLVPAPSLDTVTAVATPTANSTPTSLPPALPTPTPSSAMAPRPTAPLADTLSSPDEDDTTTWHLPGSSDIVGMRDTIVTVFQANELEFDLGYPVKGFSPDPIYSRIFIRDTSMLLAGASYFYPAEWLRWNVEAFLRQQYDETTVSSEDGWRAGFGAISATVGPDGAVDKATAVSDEDTHLVHAAYVVYQTSGGADWLTREINGLPIIVRLNAAGHWLLAHRSDKTTGLIERDHTTDWGDVRFQTTRGNPTDIVPEDVVWTASIYDQAIAYRAWRELAMMNRAVGDEATAQRWEAEANALRRATNAHLWQPERGFYRTHLHLTPLEHDFDEDAMVSTGNAVAMICGLTDAAQDAGIVAALERARLEVGARKPGLVLYPSYPAGFFALPRMSSGVYQNGGVWDWWGGWQVLAEFEAGYSEMACAHLSQTAADWAIHPGQIFEWQEMTTLDGRSGDRYASAAGTYTQAIVEGLYGIRLFLKELTLSPRLGDWPGSITVRQPASDLYLHYDYWPTANSLAIVYEINHQALTFPLRLLLPHGFTPGQVRLDGVPVAWEKLTLGQDTYLVATLPIGRHHLVVESP